MVNNPASKTFFGYGRHVKQLHSRLLQNQGRPLVFVIYGMAGVGKSEVVLQLLARYRSDIEQRFVLARFAASEQQLTWCDRYDATFCIDCSTSESIEDDVARLAKRSGWQQDTTVKDIVDRLANSNRRTLLVLDNCDDANNDYGKLIPHREKVSVVMTSRLTRSRTHASTSADLVHLERLDNEAAKDLLIEACGLSLKDAGNRRLAEGVVTLLDAHPFALRAAGNLVRLRMSSLDRFANNFRRNVAVQKGFLDESAMPDKMVKATLDISAASLEASGDVVSKDALALLDILVFMDRRSISTDVFLRAWKHGDSIVNRGNKRNDPFILQERHVDMSRNRISGRNNQDREATFRRAVGKLAALSLVSLDASGDTLSLHSLVHLWAKHRIEDPETAWLRSSIILALLAEHAESKEKWDVECRAKPHCEAVLAAVREQKETQAITVGRLAVDFRIAQLLVHTGSKLSIEAPERVLKRARSLPKKQSEGPAYIALAYYLLANAFGLRGLANKRREAFDEASKFDSQTLSTPFIADCYMEQCLHIVTERDITSSSRPAISRCERLLEPFLQGTDSPMLVINAFEELMMEYDATNQPAKISELLTRINKVTRSGGMDLKTELHLSTSIATTTLRLGRLKDARGILEQSILRAVSKSPRGAQKRTTESMRVSDIAAFEQAPQEVDQACDALAVVYCVIAKDAGIPQPTAWLTEAFRLLAGNIRRRRQGGARKDKLVHSLSVLGGMLLVFRYEEPAERILFKARAMCDKSRENMSQQYLLERGIQLVRKRRLQSLVASGSARGKHNTDDQKRLEKAVRAVAFYDKYTCPYYVSILERISHELKFEPSEGDNGHHPQGGERLPNFRTLGVVQDKRLDDEIRALVELVETL